MSALRTKGVAKQSNYFVSLYPPDSLIPDSRTVSMWCDASQTPNNTILTNDDYIEAGVKRKYAYDQDYQNLTLDFYADQDYLIKGFFDSWKKLTVSKNRSFGYPKDYTANKISVFNLDTANNITYRYDYLNVFPKSISQIELSYSASDVAKFSVEFVFEDVAAVEYVNGIDSSLTNKNSRIFIPKHALDFEQQYPDASFYDTAYVPPDVNLVQVPSDFMTYEALFNDLINIQFPNINL